MDQQISKLPIISGSIDDNVCMYTTHQGYHGSQVKLEHRGDCWKLIDKNDVEIKTFKGNIKQLNGVTMPTLGGLQLPQVEKN